MKRIRLGAILAVLVLVMALAVGSVAAQAPAYTTPFTTSITYQNISPPETPDATIRITFYGEGTPYTYEREEGLPAGAGTSLFVGGLNNVASGFRGSAVLSSNAPIVATMVQVPQNNAEVKNRPLSNGFTGDEGASRYLIPTALRTRFQATTIFSAQNVDSVALDITANFYEVGSSSPTATITRQNVAAGAATYFDLGQIAEIPENFNGSAVVTAAHTGSASTAGRIVASAMELGTTGNSVAAQYRAAAFEGSRQGAQRVYMPTALCNVFGGQTTAYAVQNTTNAQITVTVRYFAAGQAEPVGSEQKSIAAGAKQSFVACEAAGVPTNFSGSAVVESSVNDSIVAIGKKFVPQGILTTAFAGSPVGSSSLALPYVRWATETNYQAGNDRGQRAYIAIQNVGPDAVSGVQVLYKNPDGDTVCTHDLGEIPSGQKLNSSVGQNCPALTGGFGYWPDGSFGGSVLVVGPTGSQLLAIATIQSSIGGRVVAEDYNGIPTATAD